MKRRILLKVLKNYIYIYKSIHIDVNSFGEVIPKMLSHHEYQNTVKRLKSGGIKNIEGYKFNKCARRNMNEMRKYIRRNIELQKELSNINRSFKNSWIKEKSENE